MKILTDERNLEIDLKGITLAEVLKKMEEQKVFGPGVNGQLPELVKEDGETVLLISIYEDRQGTLWLSTDNKGVFRYNGEKFERFELSGK